MRILMVDDEEELLSTLSKGLRLKGYCVDCAESGDVGLQKALEEAYDLAILDLNLPEKSGFEVLQELRKTNSELKVLILSANSEIESKVYGFELGANDYLTKPFHFAELEARVSALLRRKFTQETKVLTYEAISLDTQKRTAVAGGANLRLTLKELALLEYFMLNPGRVISQHELIQHVWDESVDEFSNSIRVHLSALRKKIKAAGRDPIVTKIGEGYILP